MKFMYFIMHLQTGLQFLQPYKNDPAIGEGKVIRSLGK